MNKKHDVRDLKVSHATLALTVDGTRYEFSLAEVSPRLAAASHAARSRFEVSPAGYGVHWPEVDEDLSIDGLLRFHAARAVA